MLHNRHDRCLSIFVHEQTTRTGPGVADSRAGPHYIPNSQAGPEYIPAFEIYSSVKALPGVFPGDIPSNGFYFEPIHEFRDQGNS